MSAISNLADPERFSLVAEHLRDCIDAELVDLEYVPRDTWDGEGFDLRRVLAARRQLREREVRQAFPRLLPARVAYRGSWRRRPRRREGGRRGGRRRRWRGCAPRRVSPLQ